MTRFSKITVPSLLKHETILASLRGRILSGELRPGTQLPKRLDLERQFRVSGMTVQRALDRLISQGFVHAQAGQGTFVAETPPHLHRFALVVPQLHKPEGSHLWFSLAQEAVRMNLPGRRSFTVYAEDADGRESPNWETLQDDVLGQGLAGIVFASMPYGLVGTPALTMPKIPRVGIMPPTPGYDFPTLMHFREGLFKRGLSYLVARGCKRVAVLETLEGLEATAATVVERLARESGLLLRPHWYQLVPLAGVICARKIMQLLFGAGSPEQPDGLLITDDNIVEQATLGLRDVGIEVPRDLQVVAHTNFPWAPKAHQPVTWLGFDTDAMLANCVSILEALRREEPVPPQTWLPPVFVDELAKPLHNAELARRRDSRGKVANNDPRYWGESRGPETPEHLAAGTLEPRKSSGQE